MYVNILYVYAGDKGADSTICGRRESAKKQTGQKSKDEVK